MEYSIQELSRLSGVTTRTLRWYDEIGLLKPSRVAESGYRYYSGAEVDRLQDILYYRALGVELAQIKECLDNPSFDRLAALRSHLTALETEQKQLQALIRSVKDTIRTQERNEIMSDEQKFEAFKERVVAHNEQTYGAEIRAKYGDEKVDEANAAVMGLTQAQYQEWTEPGSGDPGAAGGCRPGRTVPGERGGQGDHRPPPPVAHHHREPVRPGQAPGNRGALCDRRAIHRLLRQSGARLCPLPARCCSALGKVKNRPSVH